MKVVSKSVLARIVVQSEANIFSLQKFTYPAFAPEALIVIVFSSLLNSLCK